MSKDEGTLLAICGPVLLTIKLVISPDVLGTMTLILIGLTAPTLANSQVTVPPASTTSPIRTTRTAHAIEQYIYPLHIAICGPFVGQSC
jgi:hypothetical protein